MNTNNGETGANGSRSLRPAGGDVRYDSIDILRGFAATSVLVYHVIELFHWESFPVSGVLSWFRIGWMGVDLFFVISGFVIGLSAFAEIDRHGADGFRWPFMRRRLTRIVPLYYLTILVFCVFIVPELLFENFFNNIMAHIFFVHNFSVGLSGAINGVNWSLATEMQFYLIIMLIAPWLLNVRWWKFLLIFIFITWAWRYGALLLVPAEHETLGSFPLFVMTTQLPGMLDEFAFGLLLARLMRSEFGNLLMLELMTIKGRVLALSVSTLFILGVLAVFWSYAGYWNYPLMVVFFRTFLGAAFALIILAACAMRLSGIWSVVFAPLVYLGTISYGIYLWQLPVLLSLKRIQWLSPEQVLWWGLGLTILFASISWHFFERPFIKAFAGKKM